MSEVNARVAAIPGDGVGVEVIAAGREALDAALRTTPGSGAIEWHEFDWGSDYYARTGQMMPADGVDTLRDFDAIYFGAVGWPTLPDHVTLWGLRLAICQGLDQWANIRPVHFLPGVQGPLRADLSDHDWLVVRENSEGEYSGFGGRNFAGRNGTNEIAVQSSVFTELGCERIMRFAFDLARKRERRHVTSVTKSNAQQYGMVLWDEVFRRVAAEYPDVTSESVLVDAMAARMVLDPESLSVVVASNLNADILSDLGSALAGGLGIASSANLNPERRTPSMFEPVHGSAPDIAGTGVCNPIGTIESGVLMLRHLGYDTAADRLLDAVKTTTRAGVRTRDLGGTATTAEVTAHIVRTLEEGAQS